MYNRRNSNLGEDIFNIVQDAINNRDFNRLNRDIGNVVNSALDEVRKPFNKIFSISPNLTVPVGKVSNILFIVFGSIGSLGSLIASIVLAIVGYSLNMSFMFNIISFGLLPLFIASNLLLLNGRRIRNRLKRFQRYISQMQGSTYYMIKDFSLSTGKSNKYIAKDLQRMIKVGMFPQGHLDYKKTCFMLNNETYEHYLILMENMKMREEIKEDEKYKKDYLDPEIRKAINEGREYVSKIREANVEIPGKEISQKLERLEEVTRKIFDYVETHPEKFPEIKKFTEYFLPTTLKLVEAYRDFEYQPVQGENISKAKREIEETMDTINHAFENLLDDLFQDAVMDISTDISVLETMIAQEGLGKNKK